MLRCEDGSIYTGTAKDYLKRYEEHLSGKGAKYTKSHKVKKIDLWNILEQHKDEAIYARTDHHWLPLAAYYAAQQFASVAKVPFCNLSSYEQQTIHRFVGSMAHFSGDATLMKSSPEDFIFYTRFV